MFVGSSGTLSFRVERTGQRADRLHALVAGASLDPSAIATLALLLPPHRANETPYVGIVADWHDRDTHEPGDEGEFSSEEASIVGLRAALDQAVDRALDGVSRAAVLTGGGVDSGVLLAVAVHRARALGKTLFAVALDFEGPGDDRPHLRALEMELGCEVVRMQPEGAAARFDVFASGVDAAPSPWPTASFETAMFERARDHGAERVLTGAGGDELFDGEPRALARLVRRGQIRDAVRLCRTMDGFPSPRSRFLSWIVKPLLAPAIPAAIRTRRAERDFMTLPEWAGPTLREVFDAHRRASIARAIGHRMTGRARRAEFETRPHRMQFVWQRHHDRIVSSVDRRDPYLDRRLLDTVCRIDPGWLLRGGRRRGLFRDAFRGIVPARVSDRMDKASFEPAFERFIAAVGGFESLRELGGGTRLADLGVVEGREFERTVSRFLRNPAGEDWVSVWPALACESFLRSRGAS